MQLSQELEQLLEPVRGFLHCETPQTWIDEAIKPENETILLRDHANCELKAAQTAMWLIRKYGIDKDSGSLLLEWAKPYEDFVYQRQRDGVFHAKKNGLSAPLMAKAGFEHSQDLIDKMVRLIKEEFHHFEQVIEIMEKRDMPYSPLHAGRYAKGMMSAVRTHEPATLIDKLIVGAYIEARSCERFAKIAPYLDAELQKFYISLLRSEARHYQDYLTLAAAIAGGDIQDRIKLIGEKEAMLIQTPDDMFRFHSGSPLQAA
ncbi:tRNA hydroxylase [Enterovibrio norvegicus]|uniref:tRNA isopentenyl-2-thiomethyl-A-37 hydroxylase MiaE n=1 Tax=Enterovibrio norvegicus TaxID=188144 RepID=UPI000CAD6830|nr:tRNA isopentenyl-2-thiomethyl-A-37 hydroxylase MiaE [Enterovibrio norvegicus]MCC4797344.1 tRNA isopentenyl-2-thiomethyl-A-37 hydroxylase MiaE [Enterovibrio norvegicus]PMI27146.1 tRNA hydroxylase [Enterovibrio norvegicus]PMI40209.1 tRNA hydroxylase [Enterovibrio norvegicus]PMN56418.1 tRNA hydroxylase [Enterovibrio norvegicus]